MKCINERDFQLYTENRLDRKTLSEIEAHAAGCYKCAKAFSDWKLLKSLLEADCFPAPETLKSKVLKGLENVKIGVPQKTTYFKKWSAIFFLVAITLFYLLIPDFEGRTFTLIKYIMGYLGQLMYETLGFFNIDISMLGAFLKLFAVNAELVFWVCSISTSLMAVAVFALIIRIRALSRNNAS